MAVRTTAAEVKKILDTDISDGIVDAFISDANLVVTDLLGDNTNVSADQLTSIEKWLTAHMIACTRDQQAQKEGAGDANITYQGKTMMGLDATFYGQQVKILDTTGTMAKALGKKQASTYAIPSWND